MVKGKNFILIFILFAELFSEFLNSYIRYSGQNILLSMYSPLKTGNIITLIITLASIVFAILNIFSSESFRENSFKILGINTLLMLIALTLTFYFTDKDYKLFSLILFFILKLYLLISLFLLYISKSKKIHPFNNFGYVLISLALMFCITFYFIYSYEDDEEYYINSNRKANAGVILGAAVWGGNRPSPVLRERINKGFEIYEKKYVSKLILTGGGSPNELTEAEVSKNELIKYGVDPKNLLIESKSNSTNEQIQYVKEKYYSKLSFTRIILISDKFHLFRSKEIGSFNDMNIDTFSSDTPLSVESYMNFCVKETFAVLIFWLFGLG